MQEEDNQTPAAPDRPQARLERFPAVIPGRTKLEENALHSELQRLVEEDFRPE